MKFLQKRIEANSASVLLLGDLHRGAPNCNIDLATKYRDYCLQHGVYVVGMGDLCEVATKHSPGRGVFEQVMNPTKQMMANTDFLRPLAVAGLLIGLLDGNHEERICKDDGFNITELLAHNLGVEYLGYSALIKFSIRKNAYTLYVTHGNGGAKTEESVKRKIKGLTNIVSADIYGMGHTHHLFKSSELVLTPDLRNGKVVTRERYYVSSGHFLSWDSSYAEQANYPMLKLGAPLVTMCGDKGCRKIEVNADGFM